MKIIGISGRKQSGKNTTANILHGIVLKKYGMIKDYNMSGDGELMVLTTNASGDEGWGEFDTTRNDPAFVEYAEHSMWPHVKLYSFANTLKHICVELFDIPHECAWGTDEQKNQIQEHLLWDNMPGVTTNPHLLTIGAVDMGCKTFGVIYHKPGPMTARQFLQFLGTDVMRKIHGPIWINSCLKKIQREQSQLAIIADVRFPNEAVAIEEAGGVLARMTRKVFEDNHSSEIALDNYKFKHFLDNQSESIDSLMVKVKSFYHNILED